MNNMSTERKLLLEGAEEESGRISLEDFQALADVEMTLFAIIDRRAISVPELLRLDVGHLLPLMRPVGENIDVYVGDVFMGTAEILVTDEKVAVRVAELRDKPAVQENER